MELVIVCPAIGIYFDGDEPLCYTATIPIAELSMQINAFNLHCTNITL
jgi:hypothetical protein